MNKLTKIVQFLNTQTLVSVIFSAAMFLGYITSTNFEVIPDEASWYLPAGIRFWFFIILPKRYWSTLFITELLLFNPAVFFLIGENIFPYNLNDFFHSVIKDHLWLPPLVNMVFAYLLGKKIKAITDTLTATYFIVVISSTTFAIAISRVLLDEFVWAVETEINVKMFVAFWVGDTIGIMIISCMVYFWNQRIMILKGPDSRKMLGYSTICIISILLTSRWLSSLTGIEDLYFIKLFSFGVVFLLVHKFRLLGTFLSLFVVYACIFISSGFSNPSNYWDFQIFIIGISVTAILLGGAYVELSKKNDELSQLVDSLKLSSKEKQHSLELAVSLADKLTRSQENERKWISRELHDEVGQVITALKTDIKLAEIKKLDSDLVSSLKQHADHIYRSIYHMLYRLRPKELEELGLVGILESEYFKNLLAKNDILYFVYIQDVNIDKNLSEDTVLMLYRIIQEAVNNIIKHSEARSCHIKMVRDANSIILTIQDNGKGFNVSENMSKSHGLASINERVISMSGELDIQSDASGTLVEVKLPSQQVR